MSESDCSARDAAERPATSTSVADEAATKKKGLDDMSRDELIAMFHRIRAQTMQIAADKKAAVEKYEACAKEKDDVRSKALAVIQRCKELEEKQASTDALRNRCEEQEELINSLKEQILHSSGTEPKQTVDELAMQLQESRAQVKTSNERIEVLKASIVTRDNEKTVLESKSIELEEQVGNLQIKVNELRDQIRSKAALAIEKIKEINEQAQQKAVELDSARMRIKELEESAVERSRIQADNSSRSSELEKQIEQLEGKLQEIGLALTESHREVDALREKDGQQEQLITTLTSKSSLLERKLTAAENQLREDAIAKEEEVEAVNMQLEEARKELAEAHEKNNAAQEELISVQRNCTELQDKLQVAMTQSEEGSTASREAMESLQGDLRRVENEREVLTAQVTELAARIANAEEVTSQQHQNAAEKETELDKLRAVEVELRERVVSLEQEVEAVKEQSRAKATKAVEMIKETKAQLQIKEQELEAATSKSSLLEGKLTAAENQLREDAIAKEEEAEAVNMQLEEARKELAEAHEKNNAAQEELISVQRNCTELQDKLQVAMTQSEEGSTASREAMESLQGDLRRVENEREVLTAQVTELAARIANAEEVTSQQHQNAAEKETELDKLRAVEVELRERVVSLEQEVEAVKEQSRAKATKAVEMIKETKAQLQIKEQELEASLARDASLVSQINEMNALLKSQQEEMDVSNYQNIIDSLRVEAVAKDERIEQQSEALIAAGAELADALQQMEDLKNNHQQVDDEAKGYAAALADAKQLQAQLEEKVTYQDSKIAEMAELESKLRERVRALKAQRIEMQEQKLANDSRIEELANDLEVKRQQVRSLMDDKVAHESNLNSISEAMLEKDKELQRLHEKVDGASLLEARLKLLEDQQKDNCPSDFDVILRCSDGERNWCLLSVPAEVAEQYGNGAGAEGSLPSITDSNGNLLFWRTEGRVLEWAQQRSNGHGELKDSFSIEENGGDLELPPIIQDELRLDYESSCQALQHRVEELLQEKEQSQQAFDTYRDRARASLLRSANEQKAANESIAELKQELKFAEEAAAEAKSQYAQALEKLEVASLKYEEQQAIAQQQTQDLNHKLVEAQTLIQEFTNESQLLKQQRLELEDRLRRVEDSAREEELLKQIEFLENGIADRDSREKQLATEMKRKGDTARQIISSKDEELMTIRMKLKAAVEAANAAVQEREKLQLSTQRAEQQLKMQQAQQAQQHKLLQQKQLEILQLREQQQMSALGFMGSFFSSTPSEHTSPETQVAGSDDVEIPTKATSGSYDTILEISQEGEEELRASSEGHGKVVAIESAAEIEERKFNEMKEELGRRALARESELIHQIKHLKMEVEVMRSRESILHNTPRKHQHAGAISSAAPPHAAADASHCSGSTKNLNAGCDRKGDVTDATTTEAASLLHEPIGQSQLNDTVATELMDAEESEREQRLLYLRQAFCGFVKAKKAVEMQHLGRVICAILGVNEAEQHTIMEHISNLEPAVVATSTLESLTSNITAMFS